MTKRTKMPYMDQHLCKLYSTKTNSSVAPLNVELDGKITHAKLVELCNKNWLKYTRLKSIANTKQMYYKELPSFNCDSNIKEIIFDDITLSTDFILSYCSNLRDNIQFDESSPSWYMNLLQFKNKSHIIAVMHHCIGDGNTILELMKVLCEIPTNLTNNTNIYNNSWSIFNLFKYYPIIPFLRLFKIAIKYEYNKRKHTNKINILEPKNGLKDKASFAMLELNDKFLSEKRKMMTENGKWIKHSFNNFMLTILSETITYFMINIIQLSNEQIPDNILVSAPVNLRPFYDNWNKETVFGNHISCYLIHIPLNPTLTFAQRLQIIKKEQDYCMNINEHHSIANILYLQSKIPTKTFVSMLRWNAKLAPITFSGVKEYNKTNWKILGQKVNKLFTFLPTPPDGPLGFAYMMTPNRKLCISTTMDDAIYGKDGAKLLMQSMKYILRKHNCLPNDRSVL